LKDLLFDEDRRYRRQYYRSYYYKSNSPDKILNIFKYIKNKFSKKFTEFDEYLNSSYDRNTFLTKFLSSCVESITSSTMNTLKFIFEWNITDEIICSLLTHAYSEKTVDKILSYCDNLSDSSINNMLSQLHILDHHHLFVKIGKKFSIDISKYINVNQLMKYVVTRDISFDNFLEIMSACPNIHVTPAIYTYFAQSITTIRYNRFRYRRNKYTLGLLTNLNSYYNKIKQEDYDIIKSHFKRLQCSFDIVKYELTEDEHKCLNNNNNDNDYYYDDDNDNDNDNDNVIDDINIDNLEVENNVLVN
jgi:hypothetical protein